MIKKFIKILSIIGIFVFIFSYSLVGTDFFQPKSKVVCDVELINEIENGSGEFTSIDCKIEGQCVFLFNPVEFPITQRVGIMLTMGDESTTKSVAVPESGIKSTTISVCSDSPTGNLRLINSGHVRVDSQDIVV